MATIFNEFEETKALVGAGSALYVDCFSTDNLYEILVPTVETPYIETSVDEVDVDVSSSSITSKVGGKTSLETAEVNYYEHRDTQRRLEQAHGRIVNCLSVAPDFTGYKYSAQLFATPSNAEGGDAWQGTLKIVPCSEPVRVDNCYPLIKPTAFIQSKFNAVNIVAMGSTLAVDLKPKYEGSTFAAKSEDTAIATVQVSGNKVTVTPVKAGSAIIEITTSKTGFASWKSTFLVIVEATASTSSTSSTSH